MPDFVDQFGITVTDNGDGTYTRGGITSEHTSQGQAVITFNGMAPEGWHPPDWVPPAGPTDD